MADILKFPINPNKDTDLNMMLRLVRLHQNYLSRFLSGTRITEIEKDPAIELFALTEAVLKKAKEKGVI